MESSEFDSDDEMHLEQEERPPAPQPLPPPIDHFKSHLHTAVYAVVYMNICIDMKDILKNIELYQFNDEYSKDTYCNEMYALIAEGHVIYKKLFKEEMDNGNEFFSGIEKNWSPPTNNDYSPRKEEEPFTVVRGRKKGRS
ncbi:hypothetical protein TNCT_624901 [Trichonephila clavata]|uniref:Uncharacterized protein n=1 Tax=Trichonephila clavata TaxID=2740835 RepID=A0A8X6LYW1_TRICU|nr:hypothetical protein TNCT_624901 [Trichonephila clavata]